MGDAFDNWLQERPSEAETDDGRLSPGTVIGAYRIVSFLGKGGFAEVYRAKGPDGEHVAIKILHRLDEQSRLRFEREANILSQIHHPNMPRLLSFGSCGDRPYLVAELLQTRELPHKDKAVASFIKAICAAANALHEKGYVHRDIKPSNVLWRGDTLVLIDFGLACLKSETPRSPSTISIVDGQRIVVGTAGYAAPEQFAGGKIDETTDVHAIGMLADACFGGKPPKCWRRIIDRATNSRNAVRYATAMRLAQRVSLRYFWRYLTITLLVLAVAYNLFVSHFGWSSLLYGIGVCYENGWCVSPNSVAAARMYIRAAEVDTDFWDGGKMLIKAGDCYANGYGVEKDLGRALERYEKAAEKHRNSKALRKVSELKARREKVASDKVVPTIVTQTQYKVEIVTNVINTVVTSTVDMVVTVEEKTRPPKQENTSSVTACGVCTNVPEPFDKHPMPKGRSKMLFNDIFGIQEGGVK